MTGVISQLMIQEGADYFIIVTENEPYLGAITNISGLNQYYEGVTAFLNITTERDLKHLYTELERVTDVNAVKLLTLIEKHFAGYELPISMRLSHKP